MNHSTPGLPVHHQLPEFTQTHVHWVGDAIQPSHSLQRNIQFSSVQSLSHVPHEPQHVRPPCPSPTPGLYPNSCPLCRWWHPTNSSSAEEYSVQFSHSVVFDSLQPHESQHAKPPCPSSTAGVYPNSCPSSRWWHPAMSCSVVPFSSCPQSLPASGYFPMSQLFTWGGQNIGVSALASVLPKNTQDWSLLGWTGWIFLQSKGLSRVFSNNTVPKHQFFGTHHSL